MERIEWTKEYPVFHKLGKFAIYISLHSDGNYHGAVVYYSKKGKWSRGEPMDVEFKTHFTLGNEEKTIFEECKKCISDQIGPDFTIGEERYRNLSA